MTHTALILRAAWMKTVARDKAMLFWFCSCEKLRVRFLKAKCSSKEISLATIVGAKYYVKAITFNDSKTFQPL